MREDKMNAEMASINTNSMQHDKKANYYRMLNEMSVNKTAKILMNRKWVDTMIQIILTAKEIIAHTGISSLSNTAKYTLLEYDIKNTPSGQRLVEKSKKPMEDDKVVVPLEDTYELILEAHIQTNHGGCTAMNKWIAESKHVVSLICAPVGISTCHQCLLSPEETTQLTLTELNEEPYGLIDIMDMNLLPDNDFKYLLIYQDVNTKFIQLRPLNGEDTVEEITMELVKIFSDFQPIKTLFIQYNVKKVFDGVLERLAVIFPVSLSFYDPMECRVIVEIESRLNDWMIRTKSTCWSVGCYFVQWEKNLLNNHDGSPHEKFFGRDLSQMDTNFDSYAIGTPSPSAGFTPSTSIGTAPDTSKRIRSIRKREDKARSEISNMAPRYKDIPVICHEASISVDDSDEDIKDPLNMKKSPILIENTSLTIDETPSSRRKPNILKNRVTSGFYSVLTHTKKSLFGETAAHLNLSTDKHDIEDPLRIDANFQISTRNTAKSSKTTSDKSKIHTIDLTDDAMEDPIDSSNFNESLKALEMAECESNSNHLESNMVTPPAVCKNATIIIEKTATVSDDKVEEILKNESPSKRIANALKSLEAKIVNVIKQKQTVKVRNKIESVVYHDTDADMDMMKPKRAKTNPLNNSNKKNEDDIRLIKEETETIVKEHTKKQQITDEPISQTTEKTIKRTEIEVIIDHKNSTDATNPETTESIAQIIKSTNEGLEMDTIAEMTRQAKTNVTNIPSSEIEINIASIKPKQIVKSRNKIESVVYEETDTEKKIKRAKKKKHQNNHTKNYEDNIEFKKTKAIVDEYIKKQTGRTTRTEEIIARIKEKTDSIIEREENNAHEKDTETIDSLTLIAPTSVNVDETIATDESDAEISETETITFADITAKAVENVVKLADDTKVARYGIPELTEPQSTKREMESDTTEEMTQQETIDIINDPFGDIEGLIPSTSVNVDEKIATDESDSEISETGTITFADITAKAVENVAKLADYTKVAGFGIPELTEPQSTNSKIPENAAELADIPTTAGSRIPELADAQSIDIKETPNDICCICNSLITKNIFVCCVCKKNLHLYCGVRIEKNRVVESICFTCIS